MSAVGEHDRQRNPIVAGGDGTDAAHAVLPLVKTTLQDHDQRQEGAADHGRPVGRRADPPVPFSGFRMLKISPSSKAPDSVAPTEPTAPVNRVPPTTTEAIANSSSCSIEHARWRIASFEITCGRP